MRPALLAAAVLAAAPRASAAPAAGTVVFEVDRRVELASVVLMLAEPVEFKSRRPDGLDPYAAAASAAFSRFSGHPAVARAAALRKSGAPASAFVRAALAPAGDALSADLRDFEAASGFAAFFETRGGDRAAFAEAARRESLRAISPESALAYMGLPFAGERRFILAPLLSADAGDAALDVRAGIPGGGAVRFGFDAFETSVATELCLAALSGFPAPAGVPPADVAAAIGLRVIAHDLGERIYAAALRRLASERLPYLEAASERLKEYEGARARYPTLQSFLPRLEAGALRAGASPAPAPDRERAAALAFLAEARAGKIDLDARRRLVFLYQDLQQDAQAKSLSDELLRSQPKNASVRIDRAELASRTGGQAAALAALAEAAPLSPGDADRRRMAALYLKLKEYASAKRLLDGLVEAAPLDARLRVDRALAAARTGDRAAALAFAAEAEALKPGAGERRRLAFLHQELQDYGPARALLDRLVEENPEDASPRVDRAGAAAAAGDRAGALRGLAEARALSPGPDVLRRAAFLYEDLKDEADARELQNELQRAAIGDARLTYDRAALAARAGEREKALKLLGEARGRAPSLDDRRLIAALYLELGDGGEAQALQDALVKAAPRDPRLRLDRAELAARTGDREAAARLLSEALALKPSGAERRRGALLLQDLKDNAGALALLGPLAREQPENAALLGDLGLCEYLNGRPEAAVRDLKAALALDPSSLAAAITLGSIYAAQGRPDLERSVYEAVPPGEGDLDLRLVLLRHRLEALAR